MKDAMKIDPTRLPRIAAWMERYVSARKYPGCSVLIRQGGEEIYFHATGHRNVEAGLPFTRDTVARIYSMTKPITTLAAMMLVEEGHFSLSSPVSEFISEFADARALVPGASRIDQTEPAPVPTLHQLMTHTSGLSYAFNPGLLPEAMAEGKIDFAPGKGPLAQMVPRVAALPLAFQPGQRWEYSVAIDVLGRVVEVVTGQSLGDVFAERIFAPLGMTETAFRVPDGTGERFAALYTPLDGDPLALNAAQAGAETLRRVDGPGQSPFETAEMHSGGGGLVGTIDDYMAFTEALRRGGQGLVSPATLAFMMRNHLPGEIAAMGPSSFAEQPMEGMGFGLGGAVVLDPARAKVPGSVGDFSWGGIASTTFWVDRVHDLSTVFFTQLSPSSSYPSRSELKALVQGCLA